MLPTTKSNDFLGTKIRLALESYQYEIVLQKVFRRKGSSKDLSGTDCWEKCKSPIG